MHKNADINAVYIHFTLQMMDKRCYNRLYETNFICLSKHAQIRKLYAHM